MRIITHANCTDGFTSAYIFKKYWKFFVPTSTQEEIDSAEIISLMPKEVKDFEFEETDVVLDLPRPSGKLLFWCDHHDTNKQEEEREEDHWEVKPSNAGYLLDIAAGNGLKITDDLAEFRRICDIMDDAQYTVEEYKKCYYASEENSVLVKLHMIAAMFHTRDRHLNNEIFTHYLSGDLFSSPLEDDLIWNMSPSIFFSAHLKAMQEWRENLDTYVEFIEDAKCVVQDDRNCLRKKGVVDRFYVYAKYDNAVYGFNCKVVDEEEARIGIGSNIFHKDRCTLNIGQLCKEVGTKFGSGSGGGHYHVGGCTIAANKLDDAKKFILDKLKGSL